MSHDLCQFAASVTNDSTTQQFLIEFGLNDLSELPSLQEFQHIPGVLPGANSE